MAFRDKVRLRLRTLFCRQHVEQDLAEELQYHLDWQTEENVSAGMTPEEARYAALRSTRNIEQRKEECRDARGITTMENIGQDLRYRWRQLRRAPAFTLTALLSFSLGIGVSVTTFSAFRAVFLRSLPYRDADRIVVIEKTGQHGFTPALTAADLEFLRRYAHSFESAASFGFFETVTLSRVSEPADLWVRSVSEGLFPLLGATPLLGRTLLPTDFRPNAPLVVVLAYETWTKYFRRDPGILRHSIFLNEDSYLVVGVMPRGFSFPKVGTAAWLPDRTPVVDPMQKYVSIVARLRADVTLSQARTEVTHIAPALLRRYRNPFQIDFHAVSADYFTVMGIPLVQGRLFSELDPAMNKGAVVINRAMAQKYWPGQDAVGQRLSSRPPSSDLVVIGVVGNTQPRSLSGDPIPEFYEDYRQYFGPAVGSTLVLRTFGNLRTVASSLRKALHSFDPEQVVENERTMEATVQQSIATPRFYTGLLGTFAAMALILTLIGVYGVASYGTTLRRREFAVRMALGAERRNLIGMVLRQGMLRALVGVVSGALGGLALTRLLAGLVYGIPLRDPVSFGIAAAVLIAGVLVAYYLPAWRSTKTDPAQLLRQE